MPASHAGYVSAGLGHPSVQQYRNIKRNRGTNPNGALVLEGTWAVRQAHEAGVCIDAVFVCDQLLRGDGSAALLRALTAAGAESYAVSERVLKRMVDRDGPDGVAAIGRLRASTLSDVRVEQSTRLVIADNIELAGNLGTIIRAADGAGASGVIVTDLRVRLTHPLVVKASMGTIFSMPVVATRREDALTWLRSSGFTIIAASPAGSVSYRAVAYAGPVGIVVGSEREGLAQFWQDAADTVASIPMLGTADSLNVAHAAALLLYEALHQQREAPS